MWRIGYLFVLAACSSPHPVVFQETVLDREPAEDPQYTMAKYFDDFVQNRMEPADRVRFEGNCKAAPHASVFCFSVLNYSRLVEKAKELEKDLLPAKYQGRTFRPHFSSKNKILNWNELKAAPLAGLLRGMPKRDRAKMMALKSEALKETECPNTAAVAIASALEEWLPKKVTLEEVGRLYEKGGTCMKDSAADQEQILTRAGLMYFAHGDFELASTVLTDASNIPGTYAGRALYWLYRAQTKRNQTAAAAETLDKLQAKYPFSFHSLVALTAAGRDPGELLSKNTAGSSKRSKQENDVNPLLEQVETLHRLNFDATASVVLNWAVAISKTGVEPEVMLYIAELKKEQGDYKSKISIISDVLYQNPSLISRQTMELYFPKVLFPVFQKHSSEIDPYFLLAIARRESAFDPNAVSSANARGLLQILPGTGRRLKKRPNLFDPETNIAVGAKYIVQLLQKTDGQVHLALAAYNAGPGKLKGWSQSYPTDDPILFTDLIPFRETREYVGSVLRNYYWYRRIHQTNLPIPAGKILELAIADKQ